MEAAERIALGFVRAERLRRARVRGAEVVDLDGLVLAFGNVPAPELNSALVEREPRDVPGAFAAAQEEFGRRGHGFGIDVQVGRHDAVDAHLRSGGFARLFGRHAMAAAPVSLAAVEPPHDVEIRMVADEVDALALARVDAEAFESDREIGERFYAPGAFGVPGVQAFVAWQGDGPVGSAIAYLHEGATGVFGVGVVPRARRRGVGAALTVEAARAFDGADLAWLHPTDEARRLYEQLGFRSVSEWEVWWARPT